MRGREKAPLWRSARRGGEQGASVTERRDKREKLKPARDGSRCGCVTHERAYERGSPAFNFLSHPESQILGSRSPVLVLVLVPVLVHGYGQLG